MLYVGAVNWTWILWKNKLYSESLSHLLSPKVTFLKVEMFCKSFLLNTQFNIQGIYKCSLKSDSAFWRHAMWVSKHIYLFKWSYCTQGDDAPRKRLSTRYGKLPLIYCQKNTRIPTTRPPTSHKNQKPIWIIATALGWLPELEGKTLLLKTPHTSNTDLEKLNWNWDGRLLQRTSSDTCGC